MVQGAGLPLEDSSTPPLCACLAMSCMVSSVQLDDPLPTWGQRVIASAWVGHIVTQRWQFTHFAWSAMTRRASSSTRCTSLAQDRSHTPQRVHRSGSRSTR